jgi:hypothetical protein
VRDSELLPVVMIDGTGRPGQISRRMVAEAIPVIERK